MKNILCILLGFTFLSALNAATIEDFIEVAKKTSSVVSSVSEIDSNNGDSAQFETSMDNQKVYLEIASKKLNSSVYTLINSDANLVELFKKDKALPAPPVVFLENLNIQVDDNALCSSAGSAVEPTDTSCTDKNCTLKQLVISKCNETECWSENPSTPRLLVGNLGGAFNMADKVLISGCLTNNNEGVKHTLNVSETGSSGGTVNFRVTLQNDTLE